MAKADGLILGITCIDDYTHDNSIAVIKNGRLFFAASEERYTRVKHDGNFPEQAIKSSISYLKLGLREIREISVGYPKRKVFSVLMHRYFYEAIPFSIRILYHRNFKLFGDLINITSLVLGKSIRNKQIKFLSAKKVTYVDHHLSHSASAYYTSGFNKCISIVLDAFGSQESGQIRSGAVYLCSDGQMNEIMSIPIYSSLGLFYVAVTYGLGFKPGDGEGKTMGLAAYGDPRKTYRLIRPYAPRFRGGQWYPGRDWISGILPSMPKLEYLFWATSFGATLGSLIINGKKEDLAASAQKILEEEFIELVKYLLKKYPGYNQICLSGGVFLNVKGNKKIMEIPGVESVFIHPNAGDGGVAVGAALILSKRSYLSSGAGTLQSCGLGESFTDRQILTELRRSKDQIRFTKSSNIPNDAVGLILGGKVIGWFQGRAEWGPRALGFRSVLADPRDIKVKEKINQVLKNREWFMPFAPSVIEEESDKYFKNFQPSSFMTLTFDVYPQKAKLFPAAIHIDNTARPNSVNRRNNPLYYRLLKRFQRQTGLPILLNTSFNRHGLPIVNSPRDAIDHLIMGAVDTLVIGDYIVNRNE